jgi:hypothetical protein
MMYVVAALAAISSIRQGYAQADALRFQGQMANLQAQEKSLQYKREELNAQRQADAIMDRLMRANGAAAARASAMGIMPFSGSPLDLQNYNTTQAGEELEINKSNREMLALGGKNALTMGQMQLAQSNEAASNAITSGWINAFASAGQAMYPGSRLGGAPQQAPAPVADANIRFLR